MVNSSQERIFVSDLYSGKEWKRKVSKMPDGQIHAIYMKEQNKQIKDKKETEAKDNEPF